jgi:uncharacterized protein (TIGR02284 family)
MRDIPISHLHSHKEQAMAEEREDRDLNRDPITDEPGSHPIGTGIGAAGGAIAAGAAGAVAGPVGAAVGGVLGAVVGGLAGKAAGEAINPTVEEAFWRENYSKESYYEQGRSFDDYSPAYRLGLSGRSRYDEDPWTEVEPRLAGEWEGTRGTSELDWNRARLASEAAWTRADEQYRNHDASLANQDTSAARTGVAGAVVDLLKDLVECCKDGEYGFRACAEQAKREDLKTTFLQRADDCRRGAQELNECLRRYGAAPEDGGSAMGAMHRGWVSIKSRLTTYDDKAVLEEAERGEDNAKARYLKVLQKTLPEDVRQVVERQYQGVLSNHDQVKMLRDQARAAG